MIQAHDVGVLQSDDISEDSCQIKQPVAIPETIDRNMDETSYQAGYEAGQRWAEQDATRLQKLLVYEFGDGKTWVDGQRDSVKKFVHIIDPAVIDFMRSREPPSASFVAGFIDGARTVESSSD